MNKNRMFFALFLTLTITAASIFVLPIANAHTPPWTVPSWTFVIAAPNPIGVGQATLIAFWLNDMPPTAGGAQGDRWIFYLDIIKPDNTNETLGPFTSDPVGGSYTMFTPTEVGNYTIVAKFPGQTLTGIPGATTNVNVNDTYTASTSKPLKLIVQEEPVQRSSEVPLPKDYWERPINAENRDWYTIAGNWLMAKYDKDAVGFEYSGNWNRYTTAPNSAHIVWTKDVTFGGIVGGQYGAGYAYYGGLQYEPKFTPPIIINGVLYRNVEEPPRYGFEAIDIRTGKLLWHQNSTNLLSLGQVYAYDTPNQHGGIPYLWSIQGSTWHMFDAFTGNYILSINNVPSGYKAFGPTGEVLVYNLNTASHTFLMWNSSLAIPPASATGSGAWQWRPDNYRGQTLNGSVGIQWNVTGNTAPSGSGLNWYWNDILISEAVINPPGQGVPILAHTAFSGKTGQQLWSQNRTDMGLYNFAGYITPNEGIYTIFVRETKQWVAWDMTTGNEVWRTDPIADDWGFYQYCAGFAYGKFYSSGYDGMVHAYDGKTGEHLWDYSAGNAGFDTPYGSWPFFGAIIFADGKIIIATNEHSPSMPLWRGEKLHVIDAETGQGVWNVSGMYSGGRNSLGAIADGYFVTFNSYDNRIYCFGKGHSATTVSASPEISVHGHSVLIKGTVTDQSSGSKDTPAISDEDMSAWMEYLHMQKPKPTDVKGVEVTLNTIDPNGNFVHIGNATCDDSGLFSYMFTPEVPGKYTIIASFEGSESYWSSSAETAIGVEDAPQATDEPTTPSTSIADQYFLPMSAGMIIAIIIAAIAIILVLRKRP